MGNGAFSSASQGYIVGHVTRAPTQGSSTWVNYSTTPRSKHTFGGRYGGRTTPSAGPGPGPDPPEALQHPDEEAYADWIRRFILHHNKRHPRDRGAAEVEAFLTHLAVAKHIFGLDAEPAKRAILFLYKEVLGEALPWLEGIESAKRPERLPVVLTRQEVESILAHLRARWDCGSSTGPACGSWRPVA